MRICEKMGHIWNLLRVKQKDICGSSFLPKSELWFKDIFTYWRLSGGELWNNDYGGNGQFRHCECLVGMD